MDVLPVIANLLVAYIEEIDEEEFPGYVKAAQVLLREVTALQEQNRVTEAQVWAVARCLENLYPAAGPDLRHEILTICETIIPFETGL